MGEWNHYTSGAYRDEVHDRLSPVARAGRRVRSERLPACFDDEDSGQFQAAGAPGYEIREVPGVDVGGRVDPGRDEDLISRWQRQPGTAVPRPTCFPSRGPCKDYIAASTMAISPNSAVSAGTAGRPGRRCLRRQDILGCSDQRLNTRVIQGSKHSAIKFRFRSQHALGDCLSLGGGPHKMLPAILRVAKPANVSAFFQTVEQQH